jgi:hypothetical protein
MLRSYASEAFGDCAEEEPMRVPPCKLSGFRAGRRRVSGAVLDVAGAAELLGVTEKVIRGRAARMLLPHHRWGGRLVFIRRELEEFFDSLPGCSMESAIENINTRHDPI